MVEFIQFVILWWYEQNTLELVSTGIIISRISHLLENHMSVAIWSLTSFINAVILVHRHKPNIIVVLLFNWRWLISKWCQNFLRGKAAIWNCRLMLRHVTSSVTNSVTNSATPADSKEVCCQAAPEGSMHYWIDWNTCNHLTNTFYILDKSMLQFWQIHIWIYIYYMLNIFDISVLQLCC